MKLFFETSLNRFEFTPKQIWLGRTHPSKQRGFVKDMERFNVKRRHKTFIQREYGLSGRQFTKWRQGLTYLET